MIDMDVKVETTKVELWEDLPYKVNIEFEERKNLDKIINSFFQKLNMDIKIDLETKYFQRYPDENNKGIEKLYICNLNYEIINDKIKLRGVFTTTTPENFIFQMNKKFNTLFYSTVNQLRILLNNPHPEG